jgi:hypothetical protein
VVSERWGFGRKLRKTELVAVPETGTVVWLVMMGEHPQLPFGKVPSEWDGSLAVEVIEGTRWFVERGSVQNYRQWITELHRANPGDLIPMQWAPQYIGVSRPGIRKRALAGKLTVFSFSVVEHVKTFLGKVENRETRTSFDYLVKSECDAWRDELFDQFEERLRATTAEQDGRAERLPKAHKRKGKKR